MTRVLFGAVVFCLILLVNPRVEATDIYIVLGQSNGWRVSSLANIPSGAETGSVVYFPMGCTPTAISFLSNTASAGQAFMAKTVGIPVIIRRRGV